MAWSAIVGIWEITSDLITLTKADRRNRETILKRYGIQWHNSEFGGLINYFHDYEWFAPNLQSNTQISLSYSSHLKKSKGVFAMWIKFSAKIQEVQNLPAIFLWTAHFHCALVYIHDCYNFYVLQNYLIKIKITSTYKT